MKPSGRPLSRDDQALLACIREGRPPADGFGHRQHLRAAWLYLQAHDFEQACTQFCADLQAFATALGAPQMYHHTLTVAAMHVLAAHGNPEHHSFEALLKHCPALETDFRALIGRHFSPELLATDRARQQWVNPDRAALPMPGTFANQTGPSGR